MESTKRLRGATCKTLRDLFELNVFAAIELASLAAMQMQSKGEGHILLCTSCLSKFATPYHGAYCASKSALEAFAKSMRMELKPDHIYVSTVHPIGTRTEFSDSSAKRSGKSESDFCYPNSFMADATIREGCKSSRQLFTSPKTGSLDKSANATHQLNVCDIPSVISILCF